ncbi:MAG: T9SS type A sorting domain-containing protein [Bacteroidia bacterium]
MKKLLLTFSALAAFVSVSLAQVAPDFTFESWTNVPFSSTVQDPNGWASLNALTLVGSPQSVFKETTAPYAGTASCKITTVKISGASIPNPFRPGQNFDTAGIVGVGTIAVTPSPNIKFGYSLPAGTVRPAMLSFASKYTPMAGDSGFVAAYITRWNGTSRDTIASGQYATGTASSSYAVNSLTLNYKPAFSTVWGDTMLVFGSSSIFRHAGAKIGSTLYIDNLAWSGYNSVNEIERSGSVSVYPNPTSERINFSSTADAEMLEVIDVTGRRIGMYSMQGNHLSLETSGFAPGVYMYNVINFDKVVINRGKFEVAH